MDSKILAIVAVVVVVGAAGGGALIYMNMGNGGGMPDGKDFDQSSGALLVYGNANCDSKIDSTDVTAIQSLIDSGGYEKVADANQDGKVNADDIDFVNDIISGKRSSVYYRDMTDGPTEVQYPITSFMGVHQFVLMPMVAIGAMQYMKGFTLSANGVSAATMLQELYDTQTNVNTSYNMVDVEKLSNLSEKPKVIMCHIKSLSNENKLEKSGIQIMHLDFSDFKGSVSAIRTAGFLLNLSESADSYVSFIDDVIKKVDTKILSKLTDDEKKTVICGYMTNCIDHKSGTYTPMAEAAGGVGVMSDDSNTYVEFNRGDEWILGYNEDMFFYMNSWGFSEDIDTVNQYKKSADYFTGLKSYKAGNFVVFNSIMPPALMVAYMAEAMYPELAGAGFGNEVNQEYLETFYPAFAAGYTAADHTFVITYDMVKEGL